MNLKSSDEDNKLSDPRFIGYQNFSAGIKSSQADVCLAGLVKNKDIFMKAQANASLKKADWFNKISAPGNCELEAPKAKKKNGLTVEQEI